MEKELTLAALDRFEARFDRDAAAQVAMNAVVKSGLSAAASRYDMPRALPMSFSVEVEPSGKILNQKSSGRCWMFAALNTMRSAAMKNLNLEDIEFSQAYPLFFDKLERTNYFLESILSTLDEPLDGRLVSFLLSMPLGDGGQWDMFASIVEKYGVAPKSLMPESFHSSNTREMNKFLTLKLREFACTLRTAHAAGESEEALRARKEEMLSTVYHMLCVFLGKPPKTVLFEARDKDKKFLRIGPMSPVEFFKKAVGWDLSDYVSLIHAPTADKPFHRTYTVAHLGNVAGGRPGTYLNVELSELKQAVVAQLQGGEPVWFGCDVGQWLDRSYGAMTLSGHDYEGALGTAFPLDKAQRLDYGESSMTHAMVFYGVNLDETGRPNRWKVENSWGDKAGQEGWYVMEDAWFDQYLYQALIHKKYLSPWLVSQFEQEPIVLAPWDPMGALAR